MLTDDDRKLLIAQGWTEQGTSWQPPTSYNVFPAEKAIKLARHPDFKLILALMG